MNFRWLVIAPIYVCIVTYASGVAANDDNSELAKDAATYLLKSPFSGAVRLRCERFGDVKSPTRAGLRCKTVVESETGSNSSAPSLTVVDVKEQTGIDHVFPSTNAVPAVVAVEKATGVDGASVRIIVMPRI